MSQLEELRGEVSHLRQLLDAGRRGRPVGGELLIALGAALGLTCLTNAANALVSWPLWLTLSPLGAIAGFGAFICLATRDVPLRHRPFMVLVLAGLAAVAGELAWRGALIWFKQPGQAESGLIRATVMGVIVGLPLALGVAAVAGLWRLRQQRDAMSPVNRSMIDIWTGIAIVMMLVVILCALPGVRLNNWFGFMLLPGVFWALWGAGWWLCGRIAGRHWMNLVAVGSVMAALGYGATFDLWMSAIFGLVALMIAPGVMLLRDARVAAHEA